jgi:hypothetical protein
MGASGVGPCEVTPVDKEEWMIEDRVSASPAALRETRIPCQTKRYGFHGTSIQVFGPLLSAHQGRLSAVTAFRDPHGLAANDGRGGDSTVVVRLSGMFKGSRKTMLSGISARRLNDMASRESKYGNRKTEIDGFVFASKREADRYSELKLLARAGEISELELQPAFDLTVNGWNCGKYIADFRYVDKDGAAVVEDAKGVRTAVYSLKRKLVKAIYGIEVRGV